MFHLAWSKFAGFATALAQEPEQVAENAAPAQSPQRVVSKTMLISIKWLPMSHVEELQNACGAPQEVGSGVCELMSSGTHRAQNAKC